MHAVICPEYGPPDVLELRELPDPSPRPGQVIVEVEAAGVNFVDALLIAGTYQIKMPTPFVPGSEVAGRVIELGEGVDHVAIGQRVMAMGTGGFASRMAVWAGAIIPLPDNLPSPTAAAFIQSYATAWYSFTRRSTIKPGDKVLVLGAGGGIGLAAVDIAKSMGAFVIAAASSADKLALAERAGADATINYLTEDLKVRAKELSGGGVDLVMDPVGGAVAEPALRSLGWMGHYLVVGFAGGSIPKLPANLILLNSRTVIGVEWGAWVGRFPADNTAMLGELVDAVADGRLHPIAPTVRPLAEAAAVLSDALERRLAGKVVLAP